MVDVVGGSVLGRAEVVVGGADVVVGEARFSGLTKACLIWICSSSSSLFKNSAT